MKIISSLGDSPDIVDSQNSPIPSIEVKSLTKRYGSVVAVRDISFTVQPGEIIGFLGPNGAGKSTTMRILSGLMMADSGEAYLCGDSVALHPERAKLRIGYMPENNPLPEDMRVVEYLRYRAQLKGIPMRKRNERINTVLEQCDLQRKARRKLIGALSKGFRQRVGIADALLAEPDVVIMDEPTIGLDPHQIQAMRSLISGLRGKMTVILSSHILPEIEACCDRVIIINQGEVVAAGDTASLHREFLPARRFKMEVAGNKQAIQKALEGVAKVTRVEPLERSAGSEFHAFEIEVEMNGPDGEDFLQVLNGVDSAKVRSLAPVEPTLEDVFMAATRRSWDEVSDPLAPTEEGVEPAHSSEN
ncbi:MAG: ATP-binding cassette domain-containing protein [Opitutales bacterium]